MKFTQIVPVSCFATLALGATISVKVGPSLVYSPDSVTAAEGDIVEFHFGSGHNVVSGAFDSPCQPNGMIFSGANPAEGDVFAVTVNSTDPIFIYCSVGRHCESGMAMAINPTSDQTIKAYMQAASKASGSSAPKAVIGGVLNPSSSSSSSSSSMSSASSSSAGASSTMSGSRTSSSAGATGASQTSSAATSTSTNGASVALGSASSTIFSTLAVLAVAFGLTM